MSDLKRLQYVIDYQFSNANLLVQALTHRSAARQHNERMEFLGDSIVNMVVAEMLYLRYTDVDEGRLTDLRARLVCRSSLADLARKLNLDEYLRTGSSLNNGAYRLDSILSDTFEALIGALYEDGGLTPCQHLLQQYLKDKIIALDKEKQVRDAKSLLQERLQRFSPNLPVYEVIKVSGQAHNRHFEIQCKLPPIRGRMLSCQTIFYGQASSRQAAEQQAATQALKTLDTEKTNSPV